MHLQQKMQQVMYMYSATNVVHISIKSNNLPVRKNSCRHIVTAYLNIIPVYRPAGNFNYYPCR